MSTNPHLHSQLLIRCGISPTSNNHSPMLSDVSPVPAAIPATNCGAGGLMQPPSVMASLGGSNSPDQLFEDLEPLSRDRSNTWPLRRPQLDINAQTSPLIHELIPEGEEDNEYVPNIFYDSAELVDVRHSGLRSASSAACGGMGSPDARSSGGYSPGVSSPTPAALPAASSNSDTSDGGPSTTSPATKKSTTRRNAWGNMSYADLITQAIMSSPEKRLTLSQVYEWMVQNVPYFRDKGDSNSSAGWKNSIRHNLSLHSRFMRIQNEGAGKSSWWVINPEAKPGRNPRRRAQTLETSSKAAAAIEKKRGRVRRKVAEMRAAQQGQTLHSANSSVVGSQASLVSHDLYPNDEDSLGALGYDTFRPRAHSNLSMPGSSARVSPSIDAGQQRLAAFDAFDDFPFDTNPIIPNDILDRTGDMRLDASPLGGQPTYQQGLNGLLSNDQMINGLGSSHNNSVMPTSQIKMEPGIRMNVKSEQANIMPLVQPPPSYQEHTKSYQELSTVHQGGNMQNPILRNQQLAGHHHNLQQTQPQPQQQQLAYNRNSAMTNGGDYFRMVNTSNGVYATNANGWPMGAPTSCAQQLPMDLANLSLPNEPGMEMDIAEVLRHEMAATGGKLDFGDFATNL